ncbi:hypothetical protein GCM10020367_65130 [Streptomyces sannanensis]|uniref:Uncharacterized protein n=1 Tax=Streptomyces sannanensis TaxID=285536 RepID=A0ABP6S4G4_9ACTN
MADRVSGSLSLQEGRPAHPDLSLVLNRMGCFDWDLDSGLLHMDRTGLEVFDRSGRGTAAGRGQRRLQRAAQASRGGGVGRLGPRADARGPAGWCMGCGSAGQRKIRVV